MKTSLVWMIVLGCLLPAMAQDTDGDGLSDADEQRLGTPADRAEVWIPVLHDGAESAARQAQESYFAGQDIVDVAFAHVAEDRCLWRVTFNGPTRLEETTLHLYLDADADPKTGRPGQPPVGGTDYMLSIVGALPRVTAYAADGSAGRPVPLRYAANGDTVWICADVPLKQHDDGLAFGLYLLCHTSGTTNPPMNDTTPQARISGVASRPGAKTILAADRTRNWQVQASFGLDVVRQTIADPANVFIEPDQLTLSGYESDLFTQRRYGHLKMTGQGATASAHPPRAGRYHVGFLMYDNADDEKIAIRVNDELAGVAVSDRSNNRHWIYWLETPRELTPADQVALEAVGAEGKHPIAGLLFMAKPPEVRDVTYTVDNFRWLAPVGTNGEVWASWTTSWPSTSRFEYRVPGQPVQVVAEPANRLVHKARLKNLPTNVTFEGRGVGTRPDGTDYAGPWVEFTAAGAPRPAPVAGTHTLPLRITNPLAVDARRWPVTSGVPFPRATISSADNLRLLHDGQEVPIEVAETGSWPDGSLKWVLITLLADVPAGQTVGYELQYGADVQRAAAGPGPASVRWQPHTTVALAGAEPVRLAEPAEREVVAGPLRSQVVREVAPGDEMPVAVEQRVETYPDTGLTRIQYTLTLTGESEFVDLEALRLQFDDAPKGTFEAELETGQRVAVPAGARPLSQRFDREYAVGMNATDGVAGRLTGNVFGPDCLMAVKDGWQNYPLGFRQVDGALQLELLPDFEPGLYDPFPFEKEGHHLFFHLRDGHYRLKRGMSKTWELAFYQGADNPLAAAGQLIQHPLVLQAPNDWNCESGAFYAVHPRDEERFPAFEEAADKNVAAYQAARERQHDYGFFNYGDWYGERGANWGNIEYDTQNAFFLEYIRSGNLDAYALGCEAELHNRDVDTVHWSPTGRDNGAVYVHQMGHVGGYYTESVPGTLGIPKASYTVSHAWVEGHFSHFFLTGDRRSWETGKAIADFFVDRELSRPYDWESARVPGWHLIMNAAALAATNDPYYLNASRIIVDRVLETQDVDPRPLPKYQAEADHREYQVGGWSRMMVPGHCLCEPRHRGNAGFMVAILLSGLTYYHDVTGEPAVKECIIRGANYLLDECYSPEVHGFRYTSCPKMGYRAGASPLMLEGIARAYRWTKDPRFVDPLTEALASSSEGAAYGKPFSQYYRNAPRLLSDLAATGLSLLEPKRPVAAQFVMPDWLAKLPPEQKIVVQAEAFSGQGGGAVEEISDRQQVWGTMITKWHADEGHWLEWTFEVPSAGQYDLRLRYASGGEAPLRKVELDGQVPAPSLVSLAFKPTGGFATGPNQWQWLTLPDADGKDLRLSLSAGRHTLRLTNLGDGLALDCLVLVRH